MERKLYRERGEEDMDIRKEKETKQQQELNIYFHDSSISFF